MAVVLLLTSAVIIDTVSQLDACATAENTTVVPQIVLPASNKRSTRGNPFTDLPTRCVQCSDALVTWLSVAGSPLPHTNQFEGLAGHHWISHAAAQG